MDSVVPCKRAVKARHGLLRQIAHRDSNSSTLCGAILLDLRYFTLWLRDAYFVIKLRDPPASHRARCAQPFVEVIASRGLLDRVLVIDIIE